ncbi:UPF0149 family protein [Sphingomonas floccifaciens]|uniref:UPF0149 family protein n=1 Tax=Sphingomonas floccifaciens TaxID=1844115 RepID=A0ABW4NBR3_9SPHN
MSRYPSRFRRLDDALADLPVEEPMLLTELDGFLTGLVIGPEAVPATEWMAVIWGEEAEGVPPFEDRLDVQWFATAVTARHEEIARDLARGKLQPIFDADPRSGDVLWDYWIDGFAEAVALRSKAWHALADDVQMADPLARLATLIAIAREESDLDSVEINAFQDRAVAELTGVVQQLYAGRVRSADARTGGAPAPTKVGRNDPCPCGSGKKHKRCCG